MKFSAKIDYKLAKTFIRLNRKMREEKSLGGSLLVFVFFQTAKPWRFDRSLAVNGDRAPDEPAARCGPVYG